MTSQSGFGGAEFRKVFTTNSWWILSLIMAVYAMFIALILSLSVNLLSPSGDMTMPLGSSSLIARLIYGTAGTNALLFPILIGALSVSSEYRYRTIVPTFLTVAKRPIALTAKLGAQLTVGLMYGLIAYPSVVAVAGTALELTGLSNGLGSGVTRIFLLRAVIAMALWAAIGVGLGTVIPNQAAVIVIIIAFTQFLEPILRMVAIATPSLGTVGKFLPGAAGEAMSGVSFYSLMGSDATTVTGDSLSAGLLPWWGGGLVLIAYAAVFLLIGYWVRWRRDVA